MSAVIRETPLPGAESAIGAVGSTADRSVMQLREAFTLASADPEGRALAVAASTEPSVGGPLAEWLYPRWWCGATTASVAGSPDAAIVPALEAARRSVAPVESGYLVLACDGQRIVAACSREDRGGRLVRRSADAVVRSSRPGMPPRPGDLVDLFGGIGEVDVEGAWWWSHSGDQASAGTPVDRWYVNIDADAAPQAVAATTRVAVVAGIPLSLKCPARTSGYARRDAFVVYVPRSLGSRFESAQAAWLADLQPLLLPGEPPLTRFVVPGLGSAQDPGGGISYGQLRCAQIAAAVARVVREWGIEVHASTAIGRQAGVELLAAVGIHAERPEEVTS